MTSMGVRALALCLGLVVVAAAPARAEGDVWEAVSSDLPKTRGGSPADINAERFRAFKLDDSALETRLDKAPKAAPNARAGRPRRSPPTASTSEAPPVTPTGSLSEETSPRSPWIYDRLARIRSSSPGSDPPTMSRGTSHRCPTTA